MKKKPNQSLLYANLVAAEIMKELEENFLKEGLMTIEINDFIDKKIREKNCIPGLLGYKGFPFSVCISINEELCHGLPSKRILMKGDIVKIDFVVERDGWISDICKSFLICDRNEYERKDLISKRNLIHTAEECMRVGIERAGPGVNLKDIAIAVKNRAERDEFFVCGEFCGHGIERGNLHVSPKIVYDPEYYNNNKDIILEEGKIITMEPIILEKKTKNVFLKDQWVYVSDVLSANHERTILITSFGSVILNDI